MNERRTLCIVLSSPRLRLSTFVVACALATAPVTASRAADGENPEQLIRIANDLRRKGDNVRAFGYLQRAHEVARTPRSAAQLGLCEQALGRFADAEVHFTQALGSNDAWVDANRSSLEASRAVVRQQLGKVQVTAAPPGTMVAVGQRAAERLSSDGVLWLAPGTVTLTFEAPGHGRSSKSVTPVVGAVATVTADLLADPSSSGAATMDGRVATRGGVSEPSHSAGRTAVTEPNADRASGPRSLLSGEEGPEGDVSAGEESSGRALRWTGIAVAGVGLGLLGAGVALRHVGETKLSALESDANAVPPRPYNPDNGNWKTFDRAGVACLIGGGVAVVTGVLLYVLNLDRGGSTAAATRLHQRAQMARADFGLVPVVSVGSPVAGGAAVGLLGRF